MGNVSLSSIEKVPMWLLQTVLGILLSSFLAWATWASVSSWKHEVRITNVETKVTDIKDDIIEIKDGQKEMNHKLDRLLENTHGPRSR